MVVNLNKFSSIPFEGRSGSIHYICHFFTHVFNYLFLTYAKISKAFTFSLISANIMLIKSLQCSEVRGISR